MKKKLLAIILTVCTVIGMMPMSAMAEYSVSGQEASIVSESEVKTESEQPISNLEQDLNVPAEPQWRRTITITETSGTITEVLNSLESMGQDVYQITVKIAKDYTLTSEDIEALKNIDKSIEIKLETVSLSTTSSVLDEFNRDRIPKTFSFKILPGAKLILDGKELFGGQNADIFIESGMVYFNVVENRWTFLEKSGEIQSQVRTKIVVQKGVHEKNLGKHLEIAASIIVKSELKILNEDALYRQLSTEEYYGGENPENENISGNSTEIIAEDGGG